MLRNDIKPREWQVVALSRWKEEMRGVVAAVTGAGKTTFALLCINEFLIRHPHGRICIVVPTTALLDQWYISLVEDMGVDKVDIGLVAAGKREIKEKRFIISVINSLRKIADQAYKYQPLLLIVDECHRAGSEQKMDVDSSVGHRRVLGIDGWIN